MRFVMLVRATKESEGGAMPDEQMRPALDRARELGNELAKRK